jgi:predicted permease
VSAFPYALRQLRRTPGFTITAVITLALGIAVTTAFFSIVNALILKPVPGLDLQGLSIVQKGASSLTLAEIRDLETNRPDDLDGIAGVSSAFTVRIQMPGRVEEVNAEFVTGTYAGVLDIPSQHGRWVRPEDDRDPIGEAVAVISDRIWREWFGAGDVTRGEHKIRVRLAGRLNVSTTFTVVGVARPEFHGIRGRFQRRHLWLPAATLARFLPEEADREQWLRFLHLTAITRLRPQIPREAAATRIGLRLDLAPPAPGKPPRTVRIRAAGTVLGGGSIIDLSLAILGLASLVLIAACANLTNMLVARGATRAAELAMRLALGASRGHLLRLVFAEVACISAVAATAGLLLALVVIDLFADAFPHLLGDRYGEFTLDLSPDVRVFGFAFAAGAIAAVAVGGITTWRVSRGALLQTLAGSGAATATPRRHLVRTTLVGVQVTAAVVLIMVAGLGWEEFRKTLENGDMYGRRVDYDTTPLTSVQVDLADHGYDDVRERVALTTLVEQLRRVNGIEGVALADALPGASKSRWTHGMTMFAARTRDGRPSTTYLVNGSFARVSPGLLQTIGLPLQRGRDIAPSDVVGAPKVAVVSARTAERLWPGEDPLGKQMVFGVHDWLTVVGVSRDPIAAPPNAPLMYSHFVFVPYLQYSRPPNALNPPRMRIVVRSRAPDGHLPAVQAAIRTMDPDVAILDASWVEDSTLAWAKPQRAATLLMTSLGALALGISMLGVYGVIAYFVSTRTREFGIRLALGATRRAVVKLVIDQAVRMTLIGLLAGVFIVSVASRVIQNRRFDFMPNEIETWIVVPILILAAGMLAGVLPALRAARVSPNVALKDL